MISEKHAQWLEDERKISVETAARLGFVSSGPRIGAQYFRDGNLIYTKYRQTDKKGGFQVVPSGARMTWWNRDCLLDPPAPNDVLIITEGEFDGAAVGDCGYQYVLSVPTGATERRGDEPGGEIDVANDRGFQYLWDDEKLTDQFARIVIWTDADGAGRALRDELVPRLGPMRCFAAIETPGLKDANDVKRAKGVEAVRAAITKALPMVPDSVTGLYDVPDRGLVHTYSTGWGDVMDRHLLLTRPEFVVVTGVPGSGKSQWTRALGARLSFPATGGGLRGCWLTPEDPVRRLKRDFYRFVQGHFGISSDPQVHQRYRDLISDKIKVIEPRDDEPMTFEWVLRQFEAAATRHDCQYLVIDPWNEIVHNRGSRTETEYIGDAIVEMKKQAKKYNLIAVVVAHPKKPAEHGNRVTGYDISGSANWRNKADHLIVVTRKKTEGGANETEIYVEKSKDWEVLGVPGPVFMGFVREKADFVVDTQGSD